MRAPALAAGAGCIETTAEENAMADGATLESQIEELLDQETFEPPEEFAENAVVTDDSVYEQAEQDPEGFWAEQAEQLHWFEKWDTVLDWSDPPNATGRRRQP